MPPPTGRGWLPLPVASTNRKIWRAHPCGRSRPENISKCSRVFSCWFTLARKWVVRADGSHSPDGALWRRHGLAEPCGECAPESGKAKAEIKGAKAASEIGQAISRAEGNQKAKAETLKF